jgi:hypothetical protein
VSRVFTPLNSKTGSILGFDAEVAGLEIGLACALERKVEQA